MRKIIDGALNEEFLVHSYNLILTKQQYLDNIEDVSLLNFYRPISDFDGKLNIQGDIEFSSNDMKKFEAYLRLARFQSNEVIKPC